MKCTIFMSTDVSKDENSDLQGMSPFCRSMSEANILGIRVMAMIITKKRVMMIIIICRKGVMIIDHYFQEGVDDEH